MWAVHGSFVWKAEELRKRGNMAPPFFVFDFRSLPWTPRPPNPPQQQGRRINCTQHKALSSRRPACPHTPATSSSCRLLLLPTSLSYSIASLPVSSPALQPSVSLCSSCLLVVVAAPPRTRHPTRAPPAAAAGGRVGAAPRGPPSALDQQASLPRLVSCAPRRRKAATCAERRGRSRRRMGPAAIGWISVNVFFAVTLVSARASRARLGLGRVGQRQRRCSCPSRLVVARV